MSNLIAVIVAFIKNIFAFKKPEQKIIYRHKRLGTEVSQASWEDMPSFFPEAWTAVIVPVDHKLAG